MKQKVLMGVMVATMFLANTSHANFTFYSSNSNGCEQVSGRWSGTGKASNWLIGDCVYQGLGTISTVDAAGKLVLDVDVNKRSGSVLCPGHASQKLTGTCVNGTVTLNTGYGNLSGNFSQNQGSARGKLSFLGLSADISVQFQRIE